MALARDVVIEGLTIEECASSSYGDSVVLPTILSTLQSPDQSSQALSMCAPSTATSVVSSFANDTDLQARGRKRGLWALKGTFDASWHLCPVLEERPSFARSSSGRSLTSHVSGESPLRLSRLSKLTRGNTMETEIKDSIREQEHADAVATLKATLCPAEVSRDDLATADASLTFKNITYSVRFVNEKNENAQMTVLENCWGHFDAGSMVAIMGPSGCGKTTLLDILANKKMNKYEGNVFLNGHEIDDMYPRIASYVPQEDHIPQYWKVMEAVKFDMMLRFHCPAGVPLENLNTFIDTLLEDVGLLHVRNSMIGGATVRGISGGQRRRLSLARGMARNHGLLFCDEPMSGLARVDAELLVVALATLTKRWNVTAVVVVHQPRSEITQLFDTLLLLVAGRTVYNGGMKDAVTYWASHGLPVPPNVSAADHFVDTATDLTTCGETFAAYYQSNVLPLVMAQVGKAMKIDGLAPVEMLERDRQMMLQFGYLPKIRNTACAMSFATQVNILLRRMVLLRSRDLVGICGDILAHILVSLLLGIVFYDVGAKEPLGLNQLAFVFTMMLHLSLCSQSQIGAVIDERSAINIEISEALYGLSAHLLAQFLFFALYVQVKNILPFIILWSFAGMDWNAVTTTYLWLTLFTMQIDSILFVLATLVPNSQSASVALKAVILLLSLSGFLVNMNSCPSFLKWLLRVSPCNGVVQRIMHKLYGDCEGWTNLQWAYGFEELSDTSCFFNLLAITVGARVLQILFAFRSYKFVR